jgi:CHAT domain-containing protein
VENLDRASTSKNVQDAESSRKELAASTRGAGREIAGPTERRPLGSRPYAHPYFWAAFVCVGAGE